MTYSRLSRKRGAEVGSEFQFTKAEFSPFIFELPFFPSLCIGRPVTFKPQASLSGVCEIVSQCPILLQLRNSPEQAPMGEVSFQRGSSCLRFWNPQNQKHKEGNTESGGFTSKSLVLDTSYFCLTSSQSILKGFTINNNEKTQDNWKIKKLYYEICEK